MVGKIKKILIFTFLFIINIEKSIADDIRDFEIEGMSVGESLLNHFTKEKINTSIVNWYDRLEKNKFTAIALKSEKFKQYDFVDIFTKYGDKSYKIDTIAGVIYFGNNKEIKDINNCYKKQINIAGEIKSMFKGSKQIGPKKTIFKNADPTGKSSYTDIYFILEDNYHVAISCYDWSDHIKNKADHLYLTIRSTEVDSWLN